MINCILNFLKLFLLGVNALASKAFELIAEKIEGLLAPKGFSRNDTDDAAVFLNEDTAYSVYYDTERGRFELRQAEADGGEVVSDWKTVSMWLYNEESDSLAEAESIAGDFSDTLSAPLKTPAALQTKKKKKKDEDSTTDPLFFFNRLANLFPDIKEDLNAEKITFGDVRPFTFAKEKILPKVSDLCRRYPQSEPAQKLCSLFSDFYENGDLDTRAIISYVLIDGLPADVYAQIAPQFDEKLLKAATQSRKLIGKKIKPEKKKKQSKVIAKSLDSYKQLQK